MIRFASLTMVICAVSIASADNSLCNLSELSGEGVLKTRVVGDKTEVYTEPLMVPCECDLDPWLRELETSDPRLGAKRALREERPIIYGEVGYTHTFPGEIDSDREFIHLVNWIKDPWGAGKGIGYIGCYEEERLKNLATRYFEIYNRLVMDGIRAK